MISSYTMGVTNNCRHVWWLGDRHCFETGRGELFSFTARLASSWRKCDSWIFNNRSATS